MTILGSVVGRPPDYDVWRNVLTSWAGITILQDITAAATRSQAVTHTATNCYDCTDKTTFVARPLPHW